MTTRLLFFELPNLTSTTDIWMLVGKAPWCVDALIEGTRVLLEVIDGLETYRVSYRMTV